MWRFYYLTVYCILSINFTSLLLCLIAVIALCPKQYAIHYQQLLTVCIFWTYLIVHKQIASLLCHVFGCCRCCCWRWWCCTFRNYSINVSLSQYRTTDVCVCVISRWCGQQSHPCLGAVHGSTTRVQRTVVQQGHSPVSEDSHRRRQWLKSVIGPLHVLLAC